MLRRASKGAGPARLLLLVVSPVLLAPTCGDPHRNSATAGHSARSGPPEAAVPVGRNPDAVARPGPSPPVSSDAVSTADAGPDPGVAEMAARGGTPEPEMWARAETPAVSGDGAFRTSSWRTILPDGTVLPHWSFDGQVHTNVSTDADYPLEAVLRRAEAIGLDAVVISDHGSTAARRSFGEVRSRVLPLLGVEIGWNLGHAVVWGVEEHPVQGGSIPLDEVAARTHAAGAFVSLAHPTWRMRSTGRQAIDLMAPETFWRPDDPARAIDAVELWNGIYAKGTEEVVAAWERILEQGVFVRVVGGSDFHRMLPRLGMPRNVALAPEPGIRQFIEAARLGRLYITGRTLLHFTVNGRILGDIVRACGGAAAADLAIEINALSRRNAVLRLFEGRDVAAERPLEAGVEFEERIVRPLPAADTWYRVEVLLRDDEKPWWQRLETFSNPILVDIGPCGDFWKNPNP
ncbi:MAG: CehA/McbA family metallohydrolase [Myxococcota bacterium]|nr:CehA/McbA family metallohydrolase [Myxococcota bacterium]